MGLYQLQKEKSFASVDNGTTIHCFLCRNLIQNCNIMQSYNALVLVA